MPGRLSPYPPDKPRSRRSSFELMSDGPVFDDERLHHHHHHHHGHEHHDGSVGRFVPHERPMSSGGIAKSSTAGKVILLTFNFLFWLTGAGLLILGAWLSLDRTKSLLLDLISVQEGEVVEVGSNLPSLRHLAYGTLGLGALVIMVGILGFCGALKESRYSLVLYAVLLLCILLAEGTMAGFAIAFRASMAEPSFAQNLAYRLREFYGKADHEPFTDTTDYAQATFQCCGMIGPEDYEASLWKREEIGQDLRLPLTCCVLEATADGRGSYLNPIPKNITLCQHPDAKFNRISLHTVGCVPRVGQWLNEWSIIFIGVAVGVVIIELTGIMLAFCLCRVIRD